ncbi:hypothetical protein J25TS5_44500 [Paenibacillus faecis]|nr:hypothetical protein J25TS5_44500 [Paenibacillus faecis]
MQEGAALGEVVLNKRERLEIHKVCNVHYNSRRGCCIDLSVTGTIESIMPHPEGPTNKF